ncbi:protein kinase [Phormidium tenue FACHB-886]|nr:protein kinase [Phormidium tenue FACHB-886]
MAGSPQSWLGQRVGDQQRYQLLQQLGSGGIGNVYLAMDTRLGRRVAIKLLKGALANSKEVLSRFEREVILSAALESEYIVEVLDYGVAAGKYPFYVMEYLQGQPLSQLIQHSTRLSAELVIEIAIQICAGLKVAHEGVVLWREGEENTAKIKVIHRDLKPANIFLVPTLIGTVVKILDFGIAKKLHTAEQSDQTNLTQAFLGTFRYAAPEQLLNSRDLDERADLYSLGMILYEMLSGTDPFGVSTTPTKNREAAWARAHSRGQPVPLRQQPECSHVLVELEEIVMRCLQRQPPDRFESALELMQALQAVPIVARPEMPTLPPQSAAELEPTVSKPLVPSLDSSFEPTVRRQLVSEASPIQNTTIAQAAANLSQSQGQLPLSGTKEAAPASPPDAPAFADGTIAQVPAPSAKEETIAQVPAQSVGQAAPIAQPSNNSRQRDETIAQVPPQPPHRDETIAQVPPRSRSQDETIAQVPPSSPPKRDETIAQMPGFRTTRGDETLAQISRGSHPRSNETIAQVPRLPMGQAPLPLPDLTSPTPSIGSNKQFNAVLRLPLRDRLLLVGTGFLMGLMIIAGGYVLLRLFQPPSSQPQQTSEVISMRP